MQLSVNLCMQRSLSKMTQSLCCAVNSMVPSIVSMLCCELYGFINCLYVGDAMVPSIVSMLCCEPYGFIKRLYVGDPMVPSIVSMLCWRPYGWRHRVHETTQPPFCASSDMLCDRSISCTIRLNMSLTFWTHRHIYIHPFNCHFPHKKVKVKEVYSC